MQYASAPWLPNVLYDREPPASTTSVTPIATHDRTSCPTLCFLLTPNTSMYSAGGEPGPASASAPAMEKRALGASPSLRASAADMVPPLVPCLTPSGAAGPHATHLELAPGSPNPTPQPNPPGAAAADSF